MFSTKLKDLRRQAKMSQEKMAEKLRVSRAGGDKMGNRSGSAGHRECKSDCVSV